MKKIFIGLCFLLASIPSMAAGANKMTMVTYFPVKYVAYSQVDVMKQMDVGLTSACQMNLGCSADEGFNTGKSLRVNNLLKIAGGKLELNDAPAIEGSTAHIGSGNGVSDFDFKTSLRVGNYKQGYTMQTDNMYLSELNLFGYKFPACSGETMSWQKLKLKNKEEVYLVCGEAEKTVCSPSKNGLETYSDTCSDGSTKITYTWNYSTCQYDTSGECPKTTYTCLTNATWKTKKLSATITSCSRWTHTAWRMDMTCGSETTHTSGYINCKAGQECSCTPGQYYLYFLTYKCADNGISGSYGFFGYYCVKCGTTNNLSNCVGPTGPGASAGSVDFGEITKD